MSRIIKSLFGFNRNTATPEEMEAYRVANEALQYRVHTMIHRGAHTRMPSRPTTDAYGRAI
jgi:hypothetical protein